MNGAEEFELRVAATPATPDDLRWQRAAEQTQFSGLAGIQATAERWSATLLAVTGLIGAVTAFAGAGQVAELRDASARVLFGVTAGLAVLVAAAAVLLAARAAQGKVVSIIPSGPELRRATMEEALIASRRLSWSRILSLATLPLFMVAVAILTYAPRAPDPMIAITLNTGEQICAAQVSFYKGELSIPSMDGSGELGVAASEVVSVRSSRECE